ncbi:hypothetical protein TorRG33x02_031350 [Trema orientale]|uniref:Zinc finger, CCHC-type n=1 Tax=Trema orientale TaxID=63057 RepID=A0A2P5FT44_TREOI|nr:hypothetical protein TorRG33x02_031350 [Trema orientale]
MELAQYAYAPRIDPVNEYYFRFTELAQYAYALGTDPTLQIVKFIEALRPVIFEKIVTQHFDNLVDLVATTQKAKAFLDNKSTLREQSRNRGNDKKANRRNQRQLQSQNSQSICFSGRGRFGPYECFHCGQHGYQKKSCLSYQQKPVLSQGRP